MIQTNIASLSAYCVRACKIKHFTERKFSGIFSLAGGNFAFSKREFPVALPVTIRHSEGLPLTVTVRVSRVSVMVIDREFVTSAKKNSRI